jgi:hypothetical protein
MGQVDRMKLNVSEGGNWLVVEDNFSHGDIKAPPIILPSKPGSFPEKYLKFMLYG